jgi:hypothetical protein
MKVTSEAPRDAVEQAARAEVHNRTLELLRSIRRRGTPEQAIEAAEIEKLILARTQPVLANAA